MLRGCVLQESRAEVAVLGDTIKWSREEGAWVASDTWSGYFTLLVPGPFTRKGLTLFRKEYSRYVWGLYLIEVPNPLNQQEAV